MAKNHSTDEPDLHGGRIRVPRSRGAIGGLLLVLLGVWGALIPLVGPYVHFGYTPDTTWHMTSGRFWLELLPGLVVALGGLLLLGAANRVVTSFGAWLAVVGGAWFLVGPTLRSLLHIGSVGGPIHTSTVGSALETLLLFSGIGALILFLAASAQGRLSVVGIRDVRAAQRRENKQDDTARRHEDTAPERDVAAPAAGRSSETPRVAAEPARYDVGDEPRTPVGRSADGSGATRVER